MKLYHKSCFKSNDFKRLMDACIPLGEYSWFIEEIRKNQKKHMTLENAVGQALSDMPDEFKIRSLKYLSIFMETVLKNVTKRTLKLQKNVTKYT